MKADGKMKVALVSVSFITVEDDSVVLLSTNRTDIKKGRDLMRVPAEPEFGVLDTLGWSFRLSCCGKPYYLRIVPPALAVRSFMVLLTKDVRSS